MSDIGFKTPFPVVPHELFDFMMRVPCEFEAEWAASRGLSAWEPVPEGKVLAVIGDTLELLPGHAWAEHGRGIPSADDGMIGIVGREEIRRFTEWWYGGMV